MGDILFSRGPHHLRIKIHGCKRYIFSPIRLFSQFDIHIVNNKGIKDTSIISFHRLMDKQYKLYPVCDMQSYSSRWWLDYAKNYISIKSYKLFNDAVQGKDISLESLHNNQYLFLFKNHKIAIELAEKYIDNKYFESYFAYYLERAIAQKLYEEELVYLFSDFKEKYPKSSYSKHLLPGVNEIIKYHVAIKDSNPEIHILKNYEKINSLEECIKLFQGENLYIDIWATWCGPCKVEFKHKQELNKLLNEKGFKLLYISTDKDINNDKWIEMINGLELGGQHVRTNELFHKNLYNMHKVYSIPRYMIVNKNGEIIYKNAAKPSEIKKLEKQLEEI